MRENHWISAVGTRRAIVAWAGALVATAVVAGVAFLGQQSGLVPGICFPLIYPVVVGATLGGTIMAIGRAVHSSCPVQWAVRAMICGLLAVGVQIGCGYGAYRQSIENGLEQNAKALLVRKAFSELGPVGFLEFVATRIERDPRGLALDAALTLAGSLTVVFLACRGPAATCETTCETTSES